MIKYFFISAGVWSLAWAIIQIVVLIGQMNYVQIQLSVVRSRKYPTSTPFVHVYDGRIQYYGDDWKYYYSTPEQRFYTGLYILQIFMLVLSALVICTVPCLVYGTVKMSKYLIWPWFIVTFALSGCSFAYCIMWWTWAPDARGARLTLTICEFTMALLNVAILSLSVYLHRIYTRTVKPVNV